MKKQYLAGGLALVFVALVGGWLFLNGARDANAPVHPAGPITEELAIAAKNGTVHVFRVEVARTNEELEKGLMFRRSLPADGGMLFEFPGEPHVLRFWMKDTFIPLDMIFITQDGIIGKIQPNAVPQSWETVSSDGPMTAVLEIGGGRAEALGIAPGDQVMHPFFQKQQ